MKQSYSDKANDKNVSEAKFDLVESLIEDYKLDWKKTGFVNEGAFAHEFYNALLVVENLARDYSNAYNDTEYDHLFYCGNQLDHRKIMQNIRNGLASKMNLGLLPKQKT